MISSLDRSLLSRCGDSVAALGSCCLLTILTFLASLPSLAQENANPNRVWYQAYLLVQSAEGLEEEGKYLEALNTVNDASRLYRQLEYSFPEFEPVIVKQRLGLLTEKRDELKYMMRNPESVRSPQIIAKPVHPEPQPGAIQRQTSIDAGGNEFSLPSWEDSSGRSQELPRIKQRETTTTVGRLSSSLYEENQRLQKLISRLTEENLTLREKDAEKQQTIELLRKQVASQSQKMENLRSQAAQSEGLEKEKYKRLFGEALREWEKTNNLNDLLLAEVEEGKARIKKLEAQVKQLTRERDNLAEVVSGNGNGGSALKELMDRNSQLTEQLDRAEKLAASLSQLKTQKDSDIELLRSEVSRVKRERDHLIEENAVHQQSIDSLQQRLSMLSDGLSQEEKLSLTHVSPLERQENEMLRGMILKQLQRQSQIKAAKDLLLKQLDKVGARSEVLLGLVEDITRSPQLSEDEKSLFRSSDFADAMQEAPTDTEIAPPSADSPSGGSSASTSVALISPGSAPNQEKSQKKEALRLAQIDQNARKSFDAGRYGEAESGFLQYLNLRPGNVNCLCNLGILKMATKSFSEAENYLERALARSPESGWANYLLGRALFLQGKDDDALEKLEAGVRYDPANAQAHNCIGVISSKKGWISRAEKAFATAVKINPGFGDAHFNLAVLYSSQNVSNPEKAGEHYQKALDLGIPPDTTIESFLNDRKSV